jgi:hypothetical protein
MGEASRSDQTALVEYCEEYVPATGIDPATFTTDYDQRGPDPVGFVVITPACPGCTHSTADVFVLKKVTQSTQSRSVFARLVKRLPLTKTVSHRASTARSVPRRSANDLADDDEGVFGSLTCQCPHIHHAPQGVTKPVGVLGCGRTWLLKATPDPSSIGSGGVRLATVPDGVGSRIVESARDAARGAATSLEKVQGKSGIWQTAMLALLLPPGVTSFVKKDEVMALPLWGIIAVAILAVASVVTVVTAVYRLHLATTGRSRVTSTGSLTQLEPPELGVFDRAMRWVWSAIAATMATFLVLIFIPPADARQNVRFTVANTAGDVSIVCGTIQIDTKQQTFILIPAAGGERKRYPMRQLVEVGPAC